MRRNYLREDELYYEIITIYELEDINTLDSIIYTLSLKKEKNILLCNSSVSKAIIPRDNIFYVCQSKTFYPEEE